MSELMTIKNIILTKEDIIKKNKESNTFLVAGYNDIDKREAAIKTNLENNIWKQNGIDESAYLKIDSTTKYENSIAEYETGCKIKFFRDKLKNGDGTGKGVHQNMIEMPSDYYQLYYALVTDLTRRRAEYPDFTGLLSQESTNLNAPNPMPIREMLEFSGVMKEYVPGQPAPLVQEKTGKKESIALQIYDIGYTRSLSSVLFDMEIFNMQKVLRAVARANVSLRNSLVWDSMIQASLNNTWSNWQIVPADTTGSTFDEQVYNTILAAYIQISALKDIQTGQEINVNNLKIAVRNRAIAWVINRIIYGQLIPSEASTVRNFAPLDINEIYTYQGDKWTWGKESVDYPGIPANRAYLFVPGSAGSPFYTVNKAPLTQEIGRGRVLAHEQEERAWYCCQGKYDGEFMGSSGEFGTDYPDGFGYVVEIELPEYHPTT